MQHVINGIFSSLCGGLGELLPVLTLAFIISKTCLNVFNTPPMLQLWANSWRTQSDEPRACSVVLNQSVYWNSPHERMAKFFPAATISGLSIPLCCSPAFVPRGLITVKTLLLIVIWIFKDGAGRRVGAQGWRCLQRKKTIQLND